MKNVKMNNEQLINEYERLKEIKNKQDDKKFKIVLFVGFIISSILALFDLDKGLAVVIAELVIYFITILIMIIAVFHTRAALNDNFQNNIDGRYIIESKNWDVYRNTEADKNYVDLNVNREELKFTTSYFVKVNNKSIKISKTLYRELLNAKLSNSKVYLILLEDEYNNLSDECANVSTTMA